VNRASLWLGALVAIAVGIGMFAWRASTDADELARPDAPAADEVAPAVGAEPEAVPVTEPSEPVRQPATPDRTASLAERMAAFPQGLRGQVVDRNERPMIGVRVYLVESARNDPLKLPMLRQQGLLMGPVTDTVSGADGTFALGLALASDKLYELLLLSPRYADLRVGDLRVLAGEWHDVGQIAMIPGTTVRGRVTVEGTMTPVPQAIVTVEANTVFEDAVLQGIPGRERGLHAITGGDGTYIIENAPARGVVRLSAAATGFARVIKHDIDLSTEGAIEAHFALPPGLTITGRITDEQQQPIAGARIEAWSAVTSAPPSIDQSRADGTFEVVGLLAGKHRLRILARGYQDATQKDIEAGQRQVRFELRSRADVIVHVTGDGRTLRAYRLGVRRFFAPRSDGAKAQIGKVQEIPDRRVRLDGMTDSFILRGVPAGEFVVQIQAEGYAKTLSGTFKVTKETSNLQIAVQMTPGGTLRGHIVGQNNAPLEGAVIVTQPNGARPDNPVWRMLSSAAPDRITKLEVVTGADGSFVLPRLAYADYQLEITHPDACRRFVLDLTVSGPGTRDLGTIRLVEGTLVFGRATSGGRVTGQIKVVLNSVIALDALPEVAAAAVRLETVTDSAGAFAMPRRVPAGEYEIRAATIDASDPDTQVFQHLMQMQRSTTRFTITAGQRHAEQHIDVPALH